MEESGKYVLGFQSNPLSEGVFLMSSIYYPCAMITVYLLFCWFSPVAVNAGPVNRFLRRYTDALEGCLHGFTAIRVYASVVLAGFLAYYAYQSGYSIFCEPAPTIDDAGRNYAKKLMRCLWWYHVVKCTDLLDAPIIMITRFWISQLQVYHHASLVFISWLGVKYLPGGSTVFPVIINLLTGSLFFFYHQQHKHLPRKRYNFQQAMYTFQTIQFSVVFLHSVVVMCQRSCSYPALASAIVIAYISSLIIFLRFYIKVNVVSIVISVCLNLGDQPWDKRTDSDEED